MAIKQAEFFPSTGASIVVIDTKYGTFSGNTIKYADDPAPTSRFFGCQIAELKALRKETRRRIQNKQIQLKTIENFYDTLKQMRNYNPKSSGAHHCRKMIKVYKRDLEKLYQRYNSFNEYFDHLSDADQDRTE